MFKNVNALMSMVCCLPLVLGGCGNTGGGNGGGGGNNNGGGSGAIRSGVWLGGNTSGEFNSGFGICFNVNDSGTALTATTACDVDQDDSDPFALEIQWKNNVGREEDGDNCNNGTGVQTTVPISNNAFRIEFTDGGNGDWVITGTFNGNSASGTARRSFGSFYCELSQWTASAP